MVLRIGNAANLLVRLGLAIIASVTVDLAALSARADDITWYGPFDPPGRWYPGGPSKTPDCEATPGSQAAWYRFCQCPGATGTSTCTIGYYSLAAYSCSGPPPKTIWLVSMRGTTNTPCGTHEIWATAMAINSLTGAWAGGEYPQPQPPDPNGQPLPPPEPPNPGGGGGIGGLDVPEGQDRPNDQTALKKDEKKTAST